MEMTCRMAKSFLIAAMLLVCAGLSLASAAADMPLLQVHSVKIHDGDDPQWAHPNYDDSGWPSTSLYEIPEPAGILWIRARIELDSRFIAGRHPTGVYFAALASHEVYWDGVLVGQGGSPGKTAREEDPGPIQAHYVVPSHLAQAGTHLIAIRTSAHHRHFDAMTGYWSLAVGDYDTIVNSSRSNTWISLISLSGMIMAGLFSIILFLTGREERSYLLLALIGFTSAALLIAESWRNLFGYTYNWHLLRLIIVTALTAAVHLLMLIFVIRRYPAKYGNFFVAGALICSCASLFSSGWDGKAFLIMVSGIAFSFAWTVRAVVHKRKGSWLAITGIFGTGLVLLWRPELFADLTLYFSINFLLLCFLAANALRIRELRVEHEETLVKSARLEIELLKRHIQPHFLLNSLTALSEWMEEAPTQAASMIQSLAEEFRILSEVSNKRLIPMKDELRLCKTHLDIMSRRKGREFHLSWDGVNPQEMIPPAVIHTLVENAVTHGKTSEPVVELKLRTERKNGRIHYIFESPSGRISESSPAVQEGTGFRYIRARLQENYKDLWDLHYGTTGSAWVTKISVPIVEMGRKQDSD